MFFISFHLLKKDMSSYKNKDTEFSLLSIFVYWLSCLVLHIIVDLKSHSSQAGIFSPLNLYGNPRQYCQWGESDRRILNLKTDFAFLSANPNPDSSSGESLDLSSKESESRLTD